MDRQAEIKGFEEFNLENKDKNKDKGKLATTSKLLHSIVFGRNVIVLFIK